MQALYIKINISESDTETEDIRNAGLFFQYVAEAVGLDRDAVEEIDEDNYLSIISEIKDRHSK